MAVSLPTAQDVRKARKQATAAVSGALEQARAPIYAALGAGELATETVVSYARKARSGATDQARITELQQRLAELPERLTDLPAWLRTRINELSTELTELRGKLEAGELHELVDSYRKALTEVYEKLATRGETVYVKLAAQPQVKRAVSRVGDAADSAEIRAERFVEEARALADEVLGRVSGRPRSAGDNTAGDGHTAASHKAERTQPVKTTPAKTTPRKTNSTTRKA